MSPFRSPWSGPLRASGVVLAGLLLMPAPSSEAQAVSPDAPAGPDALQPVIDRIQRECLRAYPEEMLAEMASGARRVPPEVEADAKAQMQFLDKEVPREKGLFYPSLLEELLPAFARYVSDGTRFLDLGSGDGRAVFLARALGAQATGIEYDEKLVQLSRRALAALAEVVDPAGVHLVQGDFFDSSWSPYDVVFYFDQSSFAQDRVRAKLRRELAPGAVLLVGHEQAPFPGLELETVFPAPRSRYPVVKVYRRPAPPDGPAAGGAPGH